MPVCIAGMHRSGTSMVTRLLHLCGLYLGEKCDLLQPTPENMDGFWENRRFLEVNELIIEQLGASWDYPPPIADRQAEVGRFALPRALAQPIVREFVDREPSGWKDPRNSLTISFWRDVFPELKVVVCL